MRLITADRWRLLKMSLTRCGIMSPDTPLFQLVLSLFGLSASAATRRKGTVAPLAVRAFLDFFDRSKVGGGGQIRKAKWNKSHRLYPDLIFAHIVVKNDAGHMDL